MLRVKGDNQLIKNVLRLKGVPFTEDLANDNALTEKELALKDQDTIIQYLDEKYPIPQLITGDVENRARVREIGKYITAQQSNALAALAAPFVFGANVTLVDLIVAQHTTNVKFKGFIESVLNATDSTGWS
jgi:glutathione S-transferase